PPDVSVRVDLTSGTTAAYRASCPARCPVLDERRSPRTRRSLPGGRGSRRDLREQDAARPAVAGLEAGDVATVITAEYDLGHGQRPGERVAIRMRQPDRPEAPMADDEPAVLHAQVV